MSLRELTQDKHKQIENLPFNQKLIGGQLNIYHYLRYLNQLLPIYGVLEKKVNLIENLKRKHNIIKDISELEEYDNLIIQPSYPTFQYVQYLNSLDEEKLMPHVYLNYMALMFGGQMIKKSIHGAGRLYDFDNVSECISFIRERQKDEWADEVNKGYDYLISIYEQLEEYS